MAKETESAAAGDAPVVTVAKGLEVPDSMVTTKAPELGAPAQQPAPWTTQTPLPGSHPSDAPAPGQRPEQTGGPADASYERKSAIKPPEDSKASRR